ncbi:aspartate/glutamate racemase family protein [Deinococcus sp. Marseille-Q6407]|uniref:aspartate/glutamate racemase family protein n=1 Tax=Deinococcus sp. Marseille-Q6407 TaxID=2969223 RepID=UPI0021BFEE75|nr:aspartate/glutamate racemase family protein [Deinococcus sp. Marseille-Q6407]
MQQVVAVIGGSPQDTRLGAEILRPQGVRLLERPISDSPRSQTRFQNADPAARQDHMRGVLREVQQQGAQGVYVYCNSLSGSTDLPSLSRELALPLVTPLHAYREWAGEYRALGVMAANASGHAGIERTLLEANPQLRLTQFGSLDLADAVEEGRPPEEIVRDFHLAELTMLLSQLGAQAIVLGCTHFPAFRSALAPLSPVPLLDPANEMWRQLAQQLL